MIVLYILLAIIALIILAFSFRLTVQLDYHDVVELEIHYLFLKFKLLPWEQKEKKPKTEKPAPASEQPPKDTSQKKKGGSKQNPLATFWNNEGIDGVIALLKKTASILSGMFRSVFRHIILDKFYLQMYIGSGDAAQTAIDYGKVCTEVFPALGAICSAMKVKKYDVDISPDFLANQSETELHAVLTLRPIFVTNAAVAMVVKLLFQVVFKLLFSKPDKSNENRIEIKQGGASS
ncbi:MAG TPA: DUF2953 domain-containing protein [Candidatus Fimivicinus intestinavium]|nr:DUF2953 domain-containing protein [Candidatus Fimivicinus intestinavium]